MYKNIKVKTAIKLYANEDPTMRMVREFKEKCERTGRRSLKKDTEGYEICFGKRTVSEVKLPVPNC